jgi:ssDNA-binding Zn-finger/Zn-ribbon topoisomerase 1
MKEIDYEKAEYVTNREVENDEGEKTGRVKMFSYDNETFHYQITCPYCGHEWEDSEELGSRPWWIECPECGRSTNVNRIKDAKKREIKERGPDADIDDADVDVT